MMKRKQAGKLVLSVIMGLTLLTGCGSSTRAYGEVTVNLAIMISGMYFKTFYYYLIVDELCKSALIGDDFISCCRFEHSVNGDIEISNFDEKAYINKHEKYALTGKEILAALSQNTSKKKYTAQDITAN